MKRSQRPLKGSTTATGGGAQKVLTALLCLGLVGMVVVAFIVPEARQPTTRLGILIDVSKTSRFETRCADVERIARAHMKDKRRRVDFVLYATGDSSRGNQVERIGSGVRKPWGFSPHSHIDPEAYTSEAVETLMALCERFGERSESPLLEGLAAVTLGTQQVTPGEPPCGSEEVKCVVVFRTDLMELEDPRLRARLAGRGTETLPQEPRIDNRQLDSLEICGFSEQQVRNGTPRPSFQQTRSAWLTEFYQPASVLFSPSCAPGEPSGSQVVVGGHSVSESNRVIDRRNP